MADTKISALTEDTARHGTNDFVPTYDASAGATKKVRVHALGVVPLRGGIATAFNPADATTYYFGVWESKAPNTTAAFRRIYIVDRPGIITGCHVIITASGLGSAETSTMSIRHNNTTDTTISSAITVTTSLQVFSNTGLSIAVSIGDYIEFKWVTPTWGTNPTGVDVYCNAIQR
jgi:hypothetical protein